MVDSKQPPQTIAERLRWARDQAGLSQGQAARALGLHRPTISQIEAGERRLKADEIKMFADLYDVREAWLLNGESVLPGEQDPRIELVARELSKLKENDLDAILRLVQVLRNPQGE